jgi:hypothetical protein
MSPNEKKHIVDKEKLYSSPEITHMGDALGLTAGDGGSWLTVRFPRPRNRTIGRMSNRAAG